MKINVKSSLLLLIAAMIWGFAFVAQDVASEKLGPFTINAVRSLIAFVFLAVIVVVKAKIKKEKIISEDKVKCKDLLICSLLCGLSFAFAYNFQQLGISLFPDDIAVSGRSGFLTGLYVIFVPIIGFVFMKKKIQLNVIISVVVAIIGLYLLCFSEGFSKIHIGDISLLISAIFFALQIIFVDKYNGKVDALKLCALQLLICGVACAVLAIIVEKPHINDIKSVIIQLIFLGLFACAIADALQVKGQQMSSNPTVDSIIMSLESVFAVIGGVIFIHEMPNLIEIIGCIIMFVAILLSQISFDFKKNII